MVYQFATVMVLFVISVIDIILKLGYIQWNHYANVPQFNLTFLAVQVAMHY